VDLLERDQCFRELSLLLRTAMTGQGRIVLVSGEAGIGKTALAEQFFRQQGQAARRLWGACDALFTPRSLGPLYDIAAQTQGALSTLLQRETPRPVLFAACLDELQHGGPTVVVIEDVHWADEATLDLIKFLGRRIAHLPVLVLLTYRDDELGRHHPLRTVLGDLPSTVVARLRLLPLSEQAVTRLARQAKERQRSAQQLYAITGGNPFFVTEVLSSDTPDVPLTVRDAVLARVARLSPAARTLLEFASVIPIRTERWLLEEALEAVPTALEECLSSGMLTIGQTTVAFRHELARLAVESTLSPLRTQALHAQVLRSLLTRGEESSQAARLVHHATGAHDETLVARYAPLAARHAAAQGAHREAAAHYATALVYADKLPLEQRAALLEGRSYECFLIGDTPLPQKRRSFLGWHLPCRSRPSQVRRVRATTLAPEGVTILFRRWQHMTGFTRIVLTQDIGTAYRVSMGHKTASRAAIGAPLGFRAVTTLRTGLAGVGFRAKYDAHPLRLSFIGNVLSLPSMRPHVNFLLAFCVQAFAIGYVAHIPDHHGTDVALLRPRDDRTARLMLHVPRPAFLLRQKATLAALEPPPGPGTSLLAGLFGAYLTQALGGALRIGTQGTAGDDDGFLSVGDGGRVNLSEVYRRRVVSWQRFWLQPILHDDMPDVVPCGPVPHQPRFQEGCLGKREQVVRQTYRNRSQPSRPCQQQISALPTDAGALPNRGAPTLLPVRVLGDQSSGFTGFGRFTRLVEALLGRVSAVRVQGGWPAQRIFQAFARLESQPHALLAIEPIVPGEHVTVDTPALAVQGVGLVFGQRAGKCDRSQHWTGLLSNVLASTPSFLTRQNRKSG